MKLNSIPNWNINIDETSNGVFMVTLTDSFGRKVEVHDIATDETIERAKSDAFDIEKQISEKWNKFLFDFGLLLLADKTVVSQKFDENTFGSWQIEIENHRKIYDGKENLLISQIKNNKEWIDQQTIPKVELSYSKFVEVFNNRYKYHFRPGYGTDNLLIQIYTGVFDETFNSDLFDVLKEINPKQTSSQDLWMNDEMFYEFSSTAGNYSLSKTTWGDVFFLSDNLSCLQKINSLLFKDPRFQKVEVDFGNYTMKEEVEVEK